MASPVPPVDEFFEISPQVWRSDAVIGAERPSLEIGEDAWIQGRTICAAIAPTTLGLWL